MDRENISKTGEKLGNGGNRMWFLEGVWFTRAFGGGADVWVSVGLLICLVSIMREVGICKCVCPKHLQKERR